MYCYNQIWVFITNHYVSKVQNIQKKKNMEIIPKDKCNRNNYKVFTIVALGLDQYR